MLTFRLSILGRRGIRPELIDGWLFGCGHHYCGVGHVGAYGGELGYRVS